MIQYNTGLHLSSNVNLTHFFYTTLPPVRLVVLHVAVELVHELAEYLSRRYPAIYIVTRHPPATGSISWYGLGQIKDITVVPLGKTFNLGEEDPMRLSALL